MRLAAFMAVTITALAEAGLPKPPLGLDLYMPVPEANPLTRENVSLGRRLFFDKALSRDRSLSCATCHDPRKAFADGRVVARGIRNAEGRRNSPAILNRGYGRFFFWDGRAATLEDQVLAPILNSRELGLENPDQIASRAGVPVNRVAASLASYVRTIRAGGSRVDRHMAGDKAALTTVEQAGLGLFRGKANCVACHVGPNFTDEEFHNTGIAWRNGAFIDDGRYAVGGRPQDRGAFKTPTLREVARTGPYMHDGTVPTLEGVVEYYSRGGRANPGLDPQVRRLDLTGAEKRALVCFLQALSGEVREGWD